MTAVLVNWRGNFERFDSVLFVSRVSRLGETVYLDIDLDKFPPKKLRALSTQCPIWRLTFNGETYFAQTSHVGHGPNGSLVISVTARVLGVIEPERVD
jgi:hypothetical protein